MLLLPRPSTALHAVMFVSNAIILSRAAVGSPKKSAMLSPQEQTPNCLQTTIARTTVAHACLCLLRAHRAGE